MAMPTYKTLKTCIFAGLLFCGFVFVTTTEVQAQTPREFSNRIERLENEIETLNRAVYRGEKPPTSTFSGGSSGGRAQADMEARLQQLESEMRGLRGTLEEQNHMLRKMQMDLERGLSDMEMRVSDMEQGGHANQQNFGQTESLSTPENITSYDQNNGAAINESYQSAIDPLNVVSNNASNQIPSVPASIPERPRKMSDDQAAMDYEDAFAKLKSGQYEAAGQGFLAFLNVYPEHVLAGNAKYWLGETFYVRGDFERAARVFAEGYKEYPESAKTADNLLKLALSLVAMENKEDACVALDQLKTDFANAPSPVTRRGTEEALRLGC